MMAAFPMMAQMAQQKSGQIGQAGGALANYFFGGDPSQPYQDAQEQMGKYYQEGQGYLNPWAQFGQNAMGKYENALGKMSDSQGYINGIMNGYQQSPWAKFQMEQGMKGMNNAASASGMVGSGAQMKAAADFSQGLSSRDMQQWFQNNFGVDQQYLGGLNNQLGYGANAANMQAQMAMQQGQNAAQAAYGGAQAANNQKTELFGSISSAFS